MGSQSYWNATRGGRRALARRNTAVEIDLRGKRVIALGERDGVPGGALAECARQAGAEVVLEVTECFV